MTTSPRLRRSWLYVPGDDDRKLVKSTDVDADVVILDLEDAVGEDRKAAARDRTRGALMDLDFGTTARFVRINAVATEHWRDDLTMILAGRPDGILLPKARNRADIEAVEDLLLVESSDEDAAPRLAAIVTEDASSVLEMPDTIADSHLLETVVWGSEDLSAALGTWDVRDEEGRLLDVFSFVRSAALLSAAAHDLDFVDTPYVDFGDVAGLERESREVARMGATGKQAIHPRQVPIINDAFTPSEETVTRAREVLDSVGIGSGVGRVGDAMADAPHLARAQSLIDHYEAARRGR